MRFALFYSPVHTHTLCVYTSIHVIPPQHTHFECKYRLLTLKRIHMHARAQSEIPICHPHLRPYPSSLRNKIKMHVGHPSSDQRPVSGYRNVCTGKKTKVRTHTNTPTNRQHTHTHTRSSMETASGTTDTVVGVGWRGRVGGETRGRGGYRQTLLLGVMGHWSGGRKRVRGGWG